MALIRERSRRTAPLKMLIFGLFLIVEMVFQPMLELLAYLRRRRAKSSIVQGRSKPR